jgi:hypothetical protein
LILFDVFIPFRFPTGGGDECFLASEPNKNAKDKLQEDSCLSEKLMGTKQFVQLLEAKALSGSDTTSFMMPCQDFPKTAPKSGKSVLKK